MKTKGKKDLISLKNVLYIVYVIWKLLKLKILKTLMDKGTKLPKFEKGEIIALKRVGKSQRNFEGLKKP